MIPVAEALDRVLALTRPLPAETVALGEAGGRVLAEDVVARLTQPPFAASAMDGYAVAGDAPAWRVVGEAAAGRPWPGRIGAGEAVRIFTGAPVPDGGTRVVIQEDVTREGDLIRPAPDAEPGPNIRPAGQDFREGDRLAAPRVLGPAEIALIAAMNVPEVRVARRPAVALIATGDELVQPGEAPGPGQIVASNTWGLAEMVRQAGGLPRMLPVARDDAASLGAAFDLARGADLVVTVGGASVGDHDLVAGVAAGRGMEAAFHKVAMRPGKPLMAGRIDGVPMIGLPGNPVSALVCGAVFLVPAILAMLGLPAGPAPRRRAPLAEGVAANGPREHYMRATLGPDGLTAAGRQDSALLTVLAGADALLIRPPGDGARAAGEVVEYLPLRP